MNKNPSPRVKIIYKDWHTEIYVDNTLKIKGCEVKIESVLDALGIEYQSQWDKS